MSKKVRVGLIGSQFISTIHAESLHRCQSAELIAVASPTPGNAERFARAQNIPLHFTDYRQMLALEELDMVAIGIPNHLHCEAVIAAATEQPSFKGLKVKSIETISDLVAWTAAQDKGLRRIV